MFLKLVTFMFLLLQEDQYVGYKILYYIVIDNDFDFNGLFFIFDIVSGNEG